MKSPLHEKNNETKQIYLLKSLIILNFQMIPSLDMYVFFKDTHTTQKHWSPLSVMVSLVLDRPKSML